MTLSVHTATYLDNHGNALANQPISVFERFNGQRRATIYSDTYGVTTIANPNTTDGSGVFSFYAQRGDYSIKVGSRGFNATVGGGTVGFMEHDNPRAVKLTTEQVTTTTLTNDPDLHVPVVVNATYGFNCFLEAYAEVLTDFRISFVGPAGSSIMFSPQAVADTAVGNIGAFNANVFTAGQAARVGSGGSSTIFTPWGIINTGATPGSLQFQFAMWNAPAEDPEFYAGSWLELRRLA